MKAIRYEKDAVLVQKGKIKAWVDVVVYDGDLKYGWNRYIFYTYRKSDMILSNWQDDVQNFEDATDLAVQTLLDLDIIYLDENDKWHQTEKYYTIKGALPIK